MKTNLLSLENLSIYLNGANGDTKKLVSNINFNIYRGEFVALIGESGSGKSLSALSTVGLLPSALKASGIGKWLDLNYDLADQNSLKMFWWRSIFEDNLHLRIPPTTSPNLVFVYVFCSVFCRCFICSGTPNRVSAILCQTCSTGAG